MVNVVLVITSFVFAGLLAAAAFYFLVYFQHPADKNVAWLPKVVVVRRYFSQVLINLPMAAASI